jgi:hypothetical protein
VANVVPSSVASRGTSARALARATIYGDLWMMLAGNRFYQYDMEQAKKGLLKKAILCLINKYSLKQLRGALHTKEPPKKSSKNRNNQL